MNVLTFRSALFLTPAKLTMILKLAKFEKKSTKGSLMLEVMDRIPADDQNSIRPKCMFRHGSGGFRDCSNVLWNYGKCLIGKASHRRSAVVALNTSAIGSGAKHHIFNF